MTGEHAGEQHKRCASYASDQTCWVEILDLGPQVLWADEEDLHGCRSTVTRRRHSEVCGVTYVIHISDSSWFLLQWVISPVKNRQPFVCPQVTRPDWLKAKPSQLDAFFPYLAAALAVSNEFGDWYYLLLNAACIWKQCSLWCCRKRIAALPAGVTRSSLTSVLTLLIWNH